MNSLQYIQPADVVRHHIRYRPTRLAGITEVAGEFAVDVEHCNGKFYRVALGKTTWRGRYTEVRIVPTRLPRWPHETLYGTDDLPESVEQIIHDRVTDVADRGR